MLTILISTNILVTMLFSLMKHPLSMGMTLLIQTVIISLITGNLNQNTWFSYILFLIMIGGMLILFMYMTSVASNEKFKPNFKLIYTAMLLPLLTLLINNSANPSVTNNEMQAFNLVSEANMSMNKFINLPLTFTLLFLMIYLLIALIATVKITEFKQGSIRQMN